MHFKGKMWNSSESINLSENKNGNGLRNPRVKKPKQDNRQRSPEREEPVGVSDKLMFCLSILLMQPEQ